MIQKFGHNTTEAGIDPRNPYYTHDACYMMHVTYIIHTLVCTSKTGLFEKFGQFDIEVDIDPHNLHDIQIQIDCDTKRSLYPMHRPCILSTEPCILSKIPVCAQYLTKRALHS